MEKKIKIITFEEAENNEEKWRMIFEAIKMLEKIIIGMMGDFDETDMYHLEVIRQHVKNAKEISLGKWQSINSLISGVKQ